jgi:hypothetical protein
MSRPPETGMGMRAGSPVLELDRVSKIYPGTPAVTALDGVSFTVVAADPPARS